jgi:hypothetical protein
VHEGCDGKLRHQSYSVITFSTAVLPYPSGPSHEHKGEEQCIRRNVALVFNENKMSWIERPTRTDVSTYQGPAEIYKFAVRFTSSRQFKLRCKLSGLEYSLNSQQIDPELATDRGVRVNGDRPRVTGILICEHVKVS